MSGRRPSTGLQLPTGITDREDRLLAYYINLISQQEKEGGGRKSTSSVSGRIDAAETESLPDPPPSEKAAPSEAPVPAEVESSSAPETATPSEPVDSAASSPTLSSAAPDQPVKRKVGRPRKYPRPDEVPPPVIVSLPEEPPSPPRAPKKHMSARELERVEAERIISTILEKRPGRPEKRDSEPSPVIETKEEEIIEPPTPLVVEKMEDVPASPEEAPPMQPEPVPPEIVKPRGRGRPAKKPRQEDQVVRQPDHPLQLVPVTASLLAVNAKPSPPALKRPTPMCSPKMEPVVSMSNFFRPSTDKSLWWKQSVRLEPVGSEKELDDLLTDTEWRDAVPVSTFLPRVCALR